MATQLRSKQTGMSLIGLIFVGSMAAMAAMVGLQVVPAYSEYSAITMAVQKAALASTEAEARDVFGKAATTNAITSITGKDLKVSTVGEKLVVSFSYQREIALFGPAYLTLKYEGSSK